MDESRPIIPIDYSYQFNNMFTYLQKIIFFYLLLSQISRYFVLQIPFVYLYMCGCIFDEMNANRQKNIGKCHTCHIPFLKPGMSTAWKMFDNTRINYYPMSRLQLRFPTIRRLRLCNFFNDLEKYAQN